MPEFEEVVVKPYFNFIRVLLSVKVFPYIFTILLFCLYILSCVANVGHGVNAIKLFASIILASIIIICTIVICFLISFTIEFIIYKNYKATTYKILKDKIEFNEGFINHKFTSIEIKNIKEVHLTQSFVQRFFKLGTIKIMTAGSNLYNGGGLTLKDIENSASVYSYINKRVNDILDVPQDNDKIITIKSDCTSSYYIFPAIGWGISNAICIVLFIAGFIMTIIDPHGKRPDSLNVFIIIYAFLSVISSVLFTLIINKWYKLEYKNRKYFISPTKIEIKEGFFNHHYTTVLMKNIKEIRLESGFIQRKFGLGSIKITTAANNIASSSDQQSNTDNYIPGIRISNLKDSALIYKQLKSIHDYSLSEDARNIANDRPQYTYRPTFKFFEHFIYLSPVILLILGCSIPAFMCWNFISGLFIFIVTSLLFMALPIFITKKNYECSKYEIYPTRIEFHEGYIINKSSAIMIKNIREVHMQEDFVERLFKLGSIKILTSGTTNDMSTNNSGAIFRDIMNCKEVYRTLKQFIKDKKENKYTEIKTDIKQDLPIEKEIFTETKNSQDINKKVQTPTMTIKPKFIFKNTFLSNFLSFLTVFLIALSILFGFIILNILLIYPEADKENCFMLLKFSFIIVPLIIAIFCAIICIIISILDKFNYNATKYEFFTDKIDFTEGFFNNKYTSIEYKNIREISLIQNLFQKIFGLGTIEIKTAAGTSFSGLILSDIENSNEIFKILENNVKAYSKNAKEESSLIIEFKPKYYFSYICLKYCTLAAFLSFLLLYFNFIAIIPAFIITALATKIILKYRNYKIFSDKIESSFSFINTHNTIIFNEKIREVHLSKDFIQRMYNIGTFNIVTSASGGQGCKLYDIANTEKINNILKEIEKNNEILQKQ